MNPLRNRKGEAGNPPPTAAWTAGSTPPTRPPLIDGHATTKSLGLKRMGRLFEKQGQDGSFKHTTSFAANDIPSVSGKGGLSSAYPSDFLYPPSSEIALPGPKI